MTKKDACIASEARATNANNLVNERLHSHEEVCAIRYEAIERRLVRMEKIIYGALAVMGLFWFNAVGHPETAVHVEDVSNIIQKEISKQLTS